MMFQSWAHHIYSTDTEKGGPGDHKLHLPSEVVYRKQNSKVFEYSMTGDCSPGP